MKERKEEGGRDEKGGRGREEAKVSTHIVVLVHKPRQLKGGRGQHWSRVGSVVCSPPGLLGPCDHMCVIPRLPHHLCE